MALQGKRPVDDFVNAGKDDALPPPPAPTPEPAARVSRRPERTVQLGVKIGLSVDDALNDWIDRTGETKRSVIESALRLKFAQEGKA